MSAVRFLCLFRFRSFFLRIWCVCCCLNLKRTDKLLLQYITSRRWLWFPFSNTVYSSFTDREKICAYSRHGLGNTILINAVNRNTNRFYCVEKKNEFILSMKCHALGRPLILPRIAWKKEYFFVESFEKKKLCNFKFNWFDDVQLLFFDVTHKMCHEYSIQFKCVKSPDYAPAVLM